LTPWSTPPGPAKAWAWAAAGLVAVVVSALLVRAKALADAPARGLPSFAILAAPLSAAPVVVPALFTHDTLRAHFFFAGLPWVCVLVSWTLWRLLPRFARIPVVVLV